MARKGFWCAIVAGAGLFFLSAAGSTFAQVSSSTGGYCGNDSSFMQCGILPQNGGTYAYPLTVSVVATSPNKILSWAVYVDGTQVQPDDNSGDIDGSTGNTTGVFDTTLSAAGTGTHTIGVNTWDDTNAVKVYQVTVTIVASPLPTPPEDAYTYVKMQTPAGDGSWDVCDSSGCSGSSGTGSGTLVLNASVDDSVLPESLSGASMLETSTGSGVNTLGYRNLGCPTTDCEGLSNFLDDFWLYIPTGDAGQLRALEFDPDVFNGVDWYKMSMQCDSATGDWQFWNEVTGHWIPRDATSQDPTAPKIACAMTTAQDQWKTGAWHHYQLFGEMDQSAGTYTYETLVLDGVTVYDDLGLTCYPKADTEGTTLNIQQQIDNETPASASSIYYDNYNFTAW
jgi:hypothetical protein